MNEQKQDSIAGKILGKIKQEDIHPEASWKFVLRRALLWTGIGLAGAFAAISLSLVIFSLLSIDQGILGFAPKRLFSPTVFQALPFLWIGSLLAFVALAVFEYRETGHGYRHRPLFVVLTTFLIVFAIGALLHLLRIGERSDIALRHAIPQYDQAVRPRDTFWRHPEAGFATGTVANISAAGFLLRTPDGDGLDIRIGDHTIIRLPLKIEEGRAVRVIGDQDANGKIDAEEILPALPSQLRGGGSEQGFNDDQPPFPPHAIDPATGLSQ
ncbi:MAG: hypothetical protein WCJ25_03875 [Candidatus Moraniibacteriota bacterium]